MKRGDLEAAAAAVELAGGAAAAETRALNQLQLDLAGAEAAAEGARVALNLTQTQKSKEDPCEGLVRPSIQLELA